jgi:hypothetical protein
MERPFVLFLGGPQQVRPRCDVRSAAQQCPPFAFGHTAPDSKLDAAVESLRKTLGTHWAAVADQLGLMLGRSLDE